MKNDELIKKYTSKESITKLITTYILYYQVSIGRYANETVNNMHETIKKVKELSLTLEPDVALPIAIMIALGDEKNAEKNIRIKAMLHALDNFVEKDKSLLNTDEFMKTKQAIILTDEAFDTNMKIQYLKEYPIMFEHYNKLISEEYIVNIQNILDNNFK